MPRAVLTDLDLGGVAKVTNSAAPSDPGDAATKGYVDARTPRITVGPTAPSNPAVNDIWFQTT